MNADWHRAHVLGRNAPLDTRVEWHRAHAVACGCRAMPESIAAEIARRDALAGTPSDDVGTHPG